MQTNHQLEAFCFRLLTIGLLQLKLNNNCKFGNHKEGSLNTCNSHEREK